MSTSKSLSTARKPSSPTRKPSSPARKPSSPTRKPSSPTRTSSSPTRTSSNIPDRAIVAKAGVELIKIVAMAIISSLNIVGVHVSDNFIAYIVSISTLTYGYIMYCVKYTVGYSKTEIGKILEEFMNVISTLLDAPRANLKKNSQEIQRCITRVATENVFSSLGFGGENKETKQLSKLKTELESTNIKVTKELNKLQNDILFNNINSVLLTFSIIKNEIENFPNTISNYIKKLIKNESKQRDNKINYESSTAISRYTVPEDMRLNEKVTSLVSYTNMRPIFSTVVSYTPSGSIVGYEEPENIEKISNVLQIKSVNLQSLLNMVEIESDILLDDESIFNEETVCGRTAKRMFTNFKMTTNNKIQEISMLVHHKIEEEKYFLKENYEHIQFITSISLIIVLSLLINKGIRTVVKSCCRRADGKRSSRRRKTSKNMRRKSTRQRKSKN